MSCELLKTTWLGKKDLPDEPRSWVDLESQQEENLARYFEDDPELLAWICFLAKGASNETR